MSNIFDKTSSVLVTTLGSPAARIAAVLPTRRRSARLAAILLAFSLAPAAAFAGAHGDPSADHAGSDRVSVENGAATEVRAEVRRVNVRNGTVSLRHEEIPHLDMPPMSMTFRMDDPEQLEGLERGAEVMVVIDRNNGEFVVRSLRPVD